MIRHMFMIYLFVWGKGKKERSTYLVMDYLATF